MSRTVSPDVEYSSDYGQDWWSGYIPENENLEELERTAVEYAYASIPRGNEVPEVFTIADWWDMENQGRVGRCAGMAAASAGEIEHFKLTGSEIQFNGHFTYILGQNRTPWRGGDNGTSIQSVVQSAKEDGYCPMDFDKDGRIDYPMPDRYTTSIPAVAKEKAKPYKMGFHSILRSWDEIVAFLQTQGTVIVGGPWGNWGPDSSGFCDSFASGGGGHAWTISGWDFSRRKYRVPVLEGVNSHGKRWGVQGFHYMSEKWV